MSDTPGPVAVTTIVESKFAAIVTGISTTLPDTTLKVPNVKTVEVEVLNS
jgi:hypothetical protein